MIPHAFSGTSRTPLRLLVAMDLTAFLRIAIAILVLSLSHALLTGDPTALIAAIQATGLAAPAIVERSATALARPVEEGVIYMKLSLSHPTGAATRIRRRDRLGPQ